MSRITIAHHTANRVPSFEPGIIKEIKLRQLPRVAPSATVDTIHNSIAFAVAVGGLKTIAKDEPAKHTRKARLCLELASAVLDEVGARLANLSHNQLLMAKKAILASEGVYLNLAKEHNCPAEIIIINLVSFCLDEFDKKLKPKTIRAFKRVQECFPGLTDYEKMRLGHRVFERLFSEAKILTAMASE